MKNDSFKSAQHSANYKDLQLRKTNKKQPVKVFTEEEKMALAQSRGLGVAPSKPVIGKIKEEKPVDLSVLPADFLKSLGINEDQK